jgi:hypothetical protein
MASNRLQGRSRLGIPPALRAILQYVENPDTTTDWDIGDNIILNADNRFISFGTDGTTDSYIRFNGTSMEFYDSTSGLKTLAELITASTMTLDQAYDQGKYIDGSAATGAANAFSVGGAAADDKVEIFHNATKATINCRTGNMDITAQGGTVNFNDEALTTTGKVTADGGLEVGADSVKLTFGIDDATDSFIQFDTANLELYTSGSIEFITSADTDDYLTISTVTHVPTIGTTGNCDLDISSSSGEITFNDDNVTIGTGTLDVAGAGTFTTTLSCATLTCTGIVNTTTAIDTTAEINIGADSTKLTLGVDDSTDSYIEFNGTSMRFYDSDHGNIVTLKDLAGGGLSSPTVTGDMIISDGKITWTDATDEVAATWTFAGVANDSIDIIANSTTSANIIHVKSTSLDSGTGVLVELTEASVSGGYYFEAYDATAPGTVFGVKEDGEIEITGAAGDMLTIGTGDIQLTDGNIDMDLGKIEVDNTADEINYFKRNNGTGTGPVVEIEQTHTDGGVALLVDQDANNTAANAVEITQAGAAYGVTVTGAAAGSAGFEFISAANATAPGLLADGTTGGAAWVGAAATGLIQAQSDGALADVAASMCYLTYTGNAGGANQTGSCLNIVDASTASGESYAASINSSANNGLQIVTAAVGNKNLMLSGVQGQTDNMVFIDGSTGTGWVGAADTGMLQLKTDGTLANAAASMVLIDFDGTYANNGLGGCLYIDDNGTADGANYSAYINSNAVNGALIRTVATTMSQLVLDGPASQTASMLKVDGSVGSWLGANGVGMVQLDNDGAFAHVNSSMLLLTNTGIPQDDSRGHCLRIVDTGNAAAGTAAYAMYLSATDATVEAMYVDAGLVDIDEGIRVNQGSAGAGLGHIKIGTTADHAGAAGENVLTIKDGAAKPAGAIANASSLFSLAGELTGIDSGGAESTLTPHTMDGDYVINSFEPSKGKDGETLRIHIEKLMDFLVTKFPEIAPLVEHKAGRYMSPRCDKAPKIKK